MIRRQLSASVSEGGAYDGRYALEPAGWSTIFAIFKGLKTRYGVAASMNRGPMLLGVEDAIAEGFIESAEEFKPTLESARGPVDMSVHETKFTEAKYFGPNEGHTPSDWLGQLTLHNTEGFWVQLQPVMPNMAVIKAYPAEILPSNGEDTKELAEKILADLAREATMA